jgi:adenylate kinase family enzyme
MANDKHPKNEEEMREDDEFKRLLNDLMNDFGGEEIDGGDENDREREPMGDPVQLGKYTLYVDENKSQAEVPVSGLVRELHLSETLYIHIDLELPDINEKGELRIIAATNKCEKKVDARFDRDAIRLFRDGNRLHVAPFQLMDLFDEECLLEGEEPAELVVSLYRNNARVGDHRIPIDGWPPKVEEKHSDAEAVLGKIDAMQGWDAFKARMREMYVRCQVDRRRNEAGLKENPPRLHTAILGNPGCGKSTAARLMASLYKELGLLKSDKVNVVRYSDLASSGISSEGEATRSAVREAQGGTLVLEDAHNLYRKDKGTSFDPETQIARALSEALSDKETYGNWMLVLVGDTQGVENVLSAEYPFLKQHLTAPIYLEDFRPDDLFGLFDRECAEKEVELSEAARQKLRMLVLHKYNLRGPGFQNAWLVKNLFNDEIIPAMYRRVGALEAPSPEELRTIQPEDIPAIGNAAAEAMQELDALVGLGKIKSKVRDYLNAVLLANRRMERGLPTNMPRLHMAFLGNPGTGKTTVAEIIGKVFASWGILSGGHVIRTEKSMLVGQWIGETEQKMRALLARARGNILFIDEAYQLVEGHEKDFGRIVMNSLLTELGKDNQDMVVILAGYTAPMKRLMESNEGIESRFPNVFNFEDYTTDELMDIGRMMISKQGFTLSAGAAENMRAILREEAAKPSPRFGNGRYVSNLIQNEIMATLGARTAALENPTVEDLCTILPEDVVIGKAQKDVVFDDVAIDTALARLDALAGLEGVKKAVHNFVRSARYLHSIGEPYVGKGLLSWRFVGKSGTGKSTVAEILAEILKGMRLIANSHITEVRGERIFNVSDYNCNEVLQEAVKRSCNGLIFIDVDDPKVSESLPGYSRLVEQIRLKVKELTVEAGGECALILAELEAPNVTVSEQLYESGFYEFDHTLVFRDFTPKELYEILCQCLGKFGVAFSEKAGKHMEAYIQSMCTSFGANARTMKLLARAIYQQVILRESGLSRRPSAHQVVLSDIETLRWDGKKGKIGF